MIDTNGVSSSLRSEEKPGKKIRTRTRKSDLLAKRTWFQVRTNKSFKAQVFAWLEELSNDVGQKVTISRLITALIKHSMGLPRSKLLSLLRIKK